MVQKNCRRALAGFLLPRDPLTAWAQEAPVGTAARISQRQQARGTADASHSPRAQGWGGTR